MPTKSKTQARKESEAAGHPHQTKAQKNAGKSSKQKKAELQAKRAAKSDASAAKTVKNWAVCCAVVAVAISSCAGASCGDAKTLQQGVDGVVFNSIYSGTYLGMEVSGTGDVNGDGFDDFLVGEYNMGSDLYLVWGHNGRRAHCKQCVGTCPVQTRRCMSLFALLQDGSYYLGAYSLSFGDVNDDGFSDILVNGIGTVDCGFAIFGQHVGCSQLLG